MHEAIQAIIRDDDLSTWDVAWRQKVTPWDDGEPQLSLKEVIETSGIPFPRTGRALVPGCGGGYDVGYLASLGLDTTGLDVSETAIEVANSLLAKEAPEVRSKAHIELSDFFKLEVPEEKRFDVVWDHTFFVAFNPSQRPDWGRQMANLVKPGGYLIISVYPIDEPMETGPPYTVRPEDYDGPLGNAFEKIWDKIPENTLPTHQEGRERLLVWKRV